MSHPRAIIPPSALAHYRQHGGKATARAYGNSWQTLRRWLVEHGEQIRPQGVRIIRNGRPS